MICTDTDYYVNALSTIKKEKKKKLQVRLNMNHRILSLYGQCVLLVF